MWANSFLPQVRHDTRVLILGSMPGRLSLEKQQYYAHPRNAFWPIMGAMFNMAVNAPYEDRLRELNQNKVGLWDVYAQCYREGSLDASIDKGSAEVNDFLRLFREYPGIQYVFFNGLAAEQAFKKHVLPSMNNIPLHFERLPSSSPAHAGLDFEGKLAAWYIIRESLHDKQDPCYR